MPPRLPVHGACSFAVRTCSWYRSGRCSPAAPALRMQSVTNFLHTAADTARETIASVTPVSNVSTFIASGCLTPEVAAPAAHDDREPLVVH